MNVYVILAEGFEELEAIAVIDILRRGKIDVKSVSITGSYEVTGRSGIKVYADMLFDKAVIDNGDMIVLPGGMPGADNLYAHTELKSLLCEYNDKGKYLAAICAGPTVFGKLGILEGKNATCYKGLESELKGAIIKDEKVVFDKNIITSKGPGTAIDFALKLAEILKGKEISDRIKAGMLV